MLTSNEFPCHSCTQAYCLLIAYTTGNISKSVGRTGSNNRSLLVQEGYATKVLPTTVTDCMSM
jgi:hypothetical protein